MARTHVASLVVAGSLLLGSGVAIANGGLPPEPTLGPTTVAAGAPEQGAPADGVDGDAPALPAGGTGDGVAEPTAGPDEEPERRPRGVWDREDVYCGKCNQGTHQRR